MEVCLQDVHVRCLYGTWTQGGSSSSHQITVKPFYSYISALISCDLHPSAVFHLSGLGWKVEVSQASLSSALLHLEVFLSLMGYVVRPASSERDLWTPTEAELLPERLTPFPRPSPDTRGRWWTSRSTDLLQYDVFVQWGQQVHLQVSCFLFTPCSVCWERTWWNPNSLWSPWPRPLNYALV